LGVLTKLVTIILQGLYKQCKKLRTAYRQYLHKKNHHIIRVDLTARAHRLLTKHLDEIKQDGKGDNVSDAVIDVLKKLK